MAHVKTSSSATINRDSKPKNLGVKIFAGEKTKPGTIIVRQKGTKFYAGEGVRMGSDYTLYAVKTGQLRFYTKLGKKLVAVFPS